MIAAAVDFAAVDFAAMDFAAHMWLDGWGMLVWIAWIGFWVLLIAAIVAMIRGRPTSGSHSAGTALRILEERYARGEIPREEFLERRSVLVRSRAAAGDAAEQPPAEAPSEDSSGDEPTKPL